MVSASVRDVLGWGTSEVIGRRICAMVRDSRSGIREHVDAELRYVSSPTVPHLGDVEILLPLFPALHVGEEHRRPSTLFGRDGVSDA